MSSRELQLDPGTLRRKAYQELPEDKVLEAIWEALDTLAADGVSLGAKADEMLAKRQEIKDKIPKG